jgi:hypothetical protein
VHIFQLHHVAPVEAQAVLAHGAAAPVRALRLVLGKGEFGLDRFGHFSETASGKRIPAHQFNDLIRAAPVFIEQFELLEFLEKGGEAVWGEPLAAGPGYPGTAQAAGKGGTTDRFIEYGGEVEKRPLKR